MASENLEPIRKLIDALANVRAADRYFIDHQFCAGMVASARSQLSALVEKEGK